MHGINGDFGPWEFFLLLNLLPFFLLYLVIYILPSLIAYIRSMHNRKKTLVVNLLLGWTVVGWIVSLVWAVSPKQPPVNSGLAADEEWSEAIEAAKLKGVTSEQLKSLIEAADEAIEFQEK